MTLILDDPTAGQPVRDLARAAYTNGVEAGVELGHADAIARIEYLAREAWADRAQARMFRDRSHPEMPDRRVWQAVADRHGAYLISLLEIRRALKEANR